MKSVLIVVPQGATVPEELRLPVAPKNDLIGAIVAGQQTTTIYAPSARELQAIVEYRDLLDVDVTAVIGLSGAMYSTIWNTYVSTMRRTTIDQLLSDQSAANDVAADAGQKEETNPFLRRRAISDIETTGLDNAGKDVASDDTTGDL